MTTGISLVDSGQANFGAGRRSGAVSQRLRAPQEEEKFLDGKRKVFFSGLVRAVTQMVFTDFLVGWGWGQRGR